MIVFLIRHGETLTSGRSYAGRRDVPLTQHGHTQARQLATALADQPISLILCSPLSRAQDTAAPLAQTLNLDPQILPEMAEIDFGAYEGRDKTSLGLNLRKAHATTPMPQGESLQDVWNRAGRVADLLARSSASCCAIIGHFWINRLLWGRLSGLDFEAACRSRAYRPKTGSCATITTTPQTKFVAKETT